MCLRICDGCIAQTNLSLFTSLVLNPFFLSNSFLLFFFREFFFILCSLAFVSYAENQIINTFVESCAFVFIYSPIHCFSVFGNHCLTIELDLFGFYFRLVSICLYGKLLNRVSFVFFWHIAFARIYIIYEYCEI